MPMVEAVLRLGPHTEVRSSDPTTVQVLWRLLSSGVSDADMRAITGPVMGTPPHVRSGPEEETTI